MKGKINMNEEYVPLRPDRMDGRLCNKMFAQFVRGWVMSPPDSKLIANSVDMVEAAYSFLNMFGLSPFEIDRVIVEH